MDFLHRNANNQPQTARTTGSQTPSSVAVSHEGTHKSFGFDQPRWVRIIILALLISITVLTLSITVLLGFGKDKEGAYIDPKKQQAVFLTNGQVYFGRLTNIGDNFVRLQGIYYLNTQATDAKDAKDTKATTDQTSFSLVKLGCELHGPTDQMVINRSQISFWENLKSDGKVAKAIEQWITQNPNGQNCSDTASNSTQQSTTDGATSTTKKP